MNENQTYNWKMKANMKYAMSLKNQFLLTGKFRN